MIAIGLAKHADPDRDQQAIALPTKGGLFVGFLVSAGGWCVSCHSFYGMHELEEREQRLHTELLAALRADDLGAAVAIHDAHGPLWTGERPMLLRTAEEVQVRPVLRDRA